MLPPPAERRLYETTFVDLPDNGGGVKRASGDVIAFLSVSKPAPATLSAKEIADGWIMLFDGESTFGWKVDGAAEVKDGALILGKGKRTIAAPITQFDSFDLAMDATGGGQFEFKNARNSGSLGFKGDAFHIELKVRRENASTTSVTHATGPDRTRLVIGDVETNSPVTLSIHIPDGNKLAIKSLKLRPHGEKPLFNGKNLDGWKQYTGDAKRSATKFTVTAEGELSAKNGPGDLRTEKQFDDFVLQFECKTNGKALNSGIFFRCIANQYQNGYEAQIQNAFLLDRSKPVDFGTGAIYRRVKARKVVSNDNEWFTMTVAARGAHIATWVNGYQTVDWTDDRKPNDNPRQGLRTAKGHLSIQGHDPTTDLLFRNIRIAELGK